MPRFRYPAKVIQSKYGIMRYTALLEICEKDFIVKMIKIHKANSQTNEKKYKCNWKNQKVQKKLNSNCQPYSLIALWIENSGAPDVKTR